MDCAVEHRNKRTEASTQKGLTTRIHAVCAPEKFALKIQIFAGNRHDAAEGRKLIESLGSKGGKHGIAKFSYIR